MPTCHPGYSGLLISLAGWLLLGLNPLVAQQTPATDDEAFRKSVERFLKLDLRTMVSHAGIPQVDALSDEELRRANLGRQLFFDPVLSSDGSTSCATCHQPDFAFSSPDALPAGVGDRPARRNAPALINRRWSSAQFWDGRAESLEEQALQPIESENELASSVDEVLEKLQQHPEYPDRFAEAFSDGITRQNLAVAIASFERVLLSSGSPVDQFITAAGTSEFTRAERQGLWIYESKGGCWQCHSGPNYSDELFHNTGVSWGAEPVDLGLFEKTNDTAHRGQFKTPTLRDVALTAPYMHDGSIATLEEVVEFYNRGGNRNPHLDGKMKPLELTDQEKSDLVAFLKALTGKHAWDP